MNIHLTQYIRRYVDWSDQNDREFQGVLSSINLKKKEFILKPGQSCSSRYFITKGLVRLYYIDRKGNEQIIHFAIDHWWITDYDSLINQKPSKLYIQALEDTELLVLQQDDFNDLTTRIPTVDRLFRQIMEKTFIAAQKRLEFIFSLPGEEQYHLFVNSNPDFVQRVPQYMIASYLGMTPEFISKIRKNKS